jgi:acyl-[acyl-carrier-protein]-phospholipid O-acyltransferase/long-chain-fatty-acid--[acyl-carrier-protein] ligase
MNIWANRFVLGFMRGVLRVWFRFRAYNEEAAKCDGPVLLIPNHLSWIDWLFVGLCLDTEWKFAASGLQARASWLHKWVLGNPRIILIDPDPAPALKKMAAHLGGGGKLVLFAEGRMSRTGSLQRLFDGTGFLVQKTGAKVITCYLRGAARVLASPHGGWTKWFPKVTAHFSDPVEPPEFKGHKSSDQRVKLNQWLRDLMVNQQFETEMKFGSQTLLTAIAEIAEQIPTHTVLEDATFQTLDYRKLLVGTDLFAGQWNRLIEKHTERVGVLLPNVNGKVVTLTSLWAIGKVPAILNYTAGTSTMLQCVELSGIKQVVTSKAFLDKAKLEAEPFDEAGVELIYLEEVHEGISSLSKLCSLLNHKFNPWAGQYTPFTDTAVVLYTSGSEGVPKGVELTHRNLLANARQGAAVLDMKDKDRFFTCLPLFHSFGLTVGLLLPLLRGLYVFLFPSPLMYRQVPAAIYDRECTVLLATNTFLNGYARFGQPADFADLRYVMSGAEKVQEATRDIWAKKFGVRISEGYGATETGPALSANTVIDSRDGTVGRLFPGVSYRIEKLDGVEEGGKLLVKGPNIMKGYLNPEPNEAFLKLDGWYDTGDIVTVDEDRYITILGRAKRFAKISGEMVSLTAVEGALAGAFPQHGEDCQVAVVTRPDADKGEQLIAATNKAELELGEIREAITAAGLPNLAAPREIKVFNEIPVLGSGKINYPELSQLVSEA